MEEERLKNLLNNYIRLFKSEYTSYKYNKSTLEKYYNAIYEIEGLLIALNPDYRRQAIDHLEEPNRRIFTIDFEEKERNISDEEIGDLAEPLTYYNKDEIKTLLDWTVLNTKNNIKDSNFGDDMDLTGACGYCQFSSLYPLQELGLDITINNLGSVTHTKERHAFGTVTFPTINDEGEMDNITYLVDCSYSQFFLLNKNCEKIYNKGINPQAGYYVKDNPDMVNTCKELLENGYIEATEENLKKIYYGVYLNAFNKNELDQAKANWNNLNLLETIKTVQEDFDYSEEEFRAWGNNIDIKGINAKNKM